VLLSAEDALANADVQRAHELMVAAEELTSRVPTPLVDLMRARVNLAAGATTVLLFVFILLSILLPVLP
jgi:hypothetical protein